jgi:hypothetical protein
MAAELLSVSGVAAVNAVQNRQTIRLFWVFLAGAFGLWALVPCSWFYRCGPARQNSHLPVRKSSIISAHRLDDRSGGIAPPFTITHSKESEKPFRLVSNTAPFLIWMSGTDKLCKLQLRAESAISSEVPASAPASLSTCSLPERLFSSAEPSINFVGRLFSPRFRKGKMQCLRTASSPSSNCVNRRRGH